MYVEHVILLLEFQVSEACDASASSSLELELVSREKTGYYDRSNGLSGISNLDVETTSLNYYADRRPD
jgi:hypothetical protein